MNGLRLASWCEVRYIMYEYIKGRFGVQNKIQAVLTFATKLEFTERAPQSERQHCRACERGPR